MIKFQSYVEQVDLTISHPEFGHEYYDDVYNLMMSEFSFKEIIELDCLCENRVAIGNFWNWFESKNTFGDLIFREIKKAEVSLNEIDFVAYLINYKSEILYDKPLSTIIIQLKEFAIEKIEDRIIQNISFIKNHLDRGIFTEKEVFGLFFINPKEDALKKIERYIFKMSSIYGFELMAQNLFVSLGRLNDILKRDFIPHIYHLNYRNLEVINNSQNSFIQFSDLKSLLNNFNYFNKNYPLVNFQSTELLNWHTDVIHKDKVIYVIEKFIEEFMDIKFDEYGNRVVDVFLSTISSNYEFSFRIYEVIRVQELISLKLKDKDVLDYYLALFNVLFDKRYVINMSIRLPKILQHYVKEISKTESTMKDYFKRSVNKDSEIFLNVLDWFDRKVSHYQ